MRRILALLLVSACWHGDVPPPAAPPPVAVKHEVPGMTLEDANAILAKLSPKDRATLQELWYMYDLQDVIGDEDDAERLMTRLETEFAHPSVLDPRVVRDALAASRGVLGTVLGSSMSKYQKSDRTVQPILDVILGPPELEKRMLAFPSEVYVAWFVVQYYSDAHYHVYRMHNRMFTLLATHGGRRALAVIEDRLRQSTGDDGASIASSEWNAATTAARKILGRREFGSWYYGVVGRSYTADRARASIDDEGD